MSNSYRIMSPLQSRLPRQSRGPGSLCGSVSGSMMGLPSEKVDHLKVVVRVRPLSQQEASLGKPT